MWSCCVCFFDFGEGLDMQTHKKKRGKQVILTALVSMMGDMEENFILFCALITL